jgi:hypothetical protein
VLNYTCSSLYVKPDLSDLGVSLLYLHMLVMYSVLKLIKVSLGAGVRSLTKDEHLYLRLCKLGEFNLAL